MCQELSLVAAQYLTLEWRKLWHFSVLCGIHPPADRENFIGDGLSTLRTFRTFANC